MLERTMFDHMDNETDIKLKRLTLYWIRYYNWSIVESDSETRTL